MVSAQGNILIDDDGRVVLSDFGLSRVLEVSGFTTKDTPGTLRYMAPELLAEEPAPGTTSGAIRTTISADVWAFAVAATEVRKAGHTWLSILVKRITFSDLLDEETLSRLRQ
jgi:serine/threonine protein kinase